MDYITPDKFLYNMRLSAQIEWLLTMDLFYTVRLDNGATLIASAAGDMELKKGEWCVFRRDFYIDSGEVCICHGELSDDNKPRETVTVIRRAEPADIDTGRENLEKARGSFRMAVKHVELLKLPMKLLNCHHSLDNKQVVIQFTADGRVIAKSGVFKFDNASAEAEKLTHADINKTVYAIDDHTVGKAGGTNKIKAGILREIDADSQVIVEIGNQVIA